MNAAPHLVKGFTYWTIAPRCCLTELGAESRSARIARFQADNADIHGGAQARALRSITKAIRTKSDAALAVSHETRVHCSLAP